MLDPRNGEVLALASVPAFDPNDFASGIAAKTWGQLMTDPLKPLQNRALQGRYAPGSVFKIAVAVAGLEEGLITPDTNFFCGGGATFYGRFFKCHVGGPHHSISLRRAIEKSCNVYFYSVGNLLGVDRMHKWASALGLGELSGIDLPSEIQGIMPSTAWKRQKYNEKWYAGETISVSIGQGQVSVTPISLAVMAMTVANGGTRHQPHLVRAIDDGNGGGWQPFPAPKPRSVATHEAVDDRRGARRPLHGGERRRHRAAAPGSKAATSPARPARRRSSRTRASCAPARPAATCATTASSSSSPRRRTPRSPAWSSPSTPSTARAPPRSRST